MTETKLMESVKQLHKMVHDDVDCISEMTNNLADKMINEILFGYEQTAKVRNLLRIRKIIADNLLKEIEIVWEEHEETKAECL